LRRLRLFSFGGNGLALAALALVVFGSYDSYPVLSAASLESSSFSMNEKKTFLFRFV